jgi:hypothetical protein
MVLYGSEVMYGSRFALDPPPRKAYPPGSVTPAGLLAENTVMRTPSSTSCTVTFTWSYARSGGRYTMVLKYVNSPP